MSLLIKALEKAARERQEKAAREGACTAADGLTLEPMAPAGDDGSQHDAPVVHDGQRQAASAFIAASAPARGTFVVDYLRERPMLAFYIAAALFAIGYGTYVYLQISHPGLFVARAAPAARPVPVTAASHTAVAPPPHARAADVPAVSGTAGTPPAIPASGATGTVRVATTPDTAAVQAPPASAPGKPAAPSAAASFAGASTPAQVAVPVPTQTHRRSTQQHVAIAAQTSTPANRQRPPERIRRGQAETAAARSSDHAIKVTPGGPTPTINPLLTQAYGAYESGDYQRALALYRRVAHAEPLNTDALLGLAAAAAQTGNEKEAARSYGRVLDIDPQNPLAQAGLINLLGHSDPNAAEARLKLLLARKPSAFVYFAMGNVYAGEGRWADAQEAYAQAYHRQPDNADYAYNVAVGLEHLGRGGSALHFYRRAVELAEQGGHVHFSVAAARTQISQLAANAE